MSWFNVFRHITSVVLEIRSENQIQTSMDTTAVYVLSLAQTSAFLWAGTKKGADNPAFLLGFTDWKVGNIKMCIYQNHVFLEAGPNLSSPLSSAKWGRRWDEKEEESKRSSHIFLNPEMEMGPFLPSLLQMNVARNSWRHCPAFFPESLGWTSNSLQECVGSYLLSWKGLILNAYSFQPCISIPRNLPYSFTSTHGELYIYIYIYIYTHTHTYIHTVRPLHMNKFCSKSSFISPTCS